MWSRGFVMKNATLKTRMSSCKVMGLGKNVAFVRRPRKRHRFGSDRRSTPCRWDLGPRFRCLDAQSLHNTQAKPLPLVVKHPWPTPTTQRYHLGNWIMKVEYTIVTSSGDYRTNWLIYEDRARIFSEHGLRQLVSGNTQFKLSTFITSVFTSATQTIHN